MRVDLPPAQRAQGTPLMRLTQACARGLADVLARVEVAGLDGMPEGPVLLAANHTHFVDGPMLYGLVRRPAAFFVKAEAFIGPLDPLLRRIGQIAVHRGVAERAPLTAALDTLAAGGLIGVFPEGTRGAGDVARVERGIAYLAVRSGAPVVPVACVGTTGMIRRRSFRRPRVRVVVGRPLLVASGDGASRSAVDAAAEQIRCALADLVAKAGAGDD